MRYELLRLKIYFLGFERAAGVRHRQGINEQFAKRGRNENGGATAIGGRSDEHHL